MARIATNRYLHKAQKMKSDEFYTQLCDIERELTYYKTAFIGQTVYCNCDDPSRSNFVRYFVEHFIELQLKKIIISCYTSTTNNLFQCDEKRNGCYYEYTMEEVRKGIVYPLPVLPLNNDGDFRGMWSVRKMQEADIIVTNPPFSLFREFLKLIVTSNKKFLIIANINALTYKEVFQLIKEDKIWLGHNLGRGISGFIVPENYELYGTETHIDATTGDRIVATNNCLWLTNLSTPDRNKLLELTHTYIGNENHYPKYDNCNAINVNRTDTIPIDFEGLMGVPITFLHKYNPLQFEIVKFRKGDDDKDLTIGGKCPYFRILIRNKQPIL